MLAWMLQQVGFSDHLIHHLDQARFVVNRPLALYLGLPLLIPAAIFIFWRHRRHLGSGSPKLLLALTTLRVILLGLLVAIIAQPSLKIDVQAREKPLLTLVFDHSESMTLASGVSRDGGHQLSRIELVRTAVRNSSSDLWEPLSHKFDLRVVAFGREPETLPLKPGRFHLPEPSAGAADATHAGDAIAHVLDQAGGRRLAGIVLFTDGQNTGGRSPLDAAKSAGSPVFAVPPGPTAAVRDVAISDVFTSGVVSVGDTATVTATVESQGLDARPVKVELREDDKVLDVKDLTLNGGEQQQVSLSFQATTPGVRSLTVHVPPMPEEGEPLRVNNTDTAFVRVSAEKLKVLYLEGTPRWDFRFLKNSMLRDAGLVPHLLLEAEVRRLPANHQTAVVPRTLDQVSQYHTIILGDVSPRLLTPDLVDLIDRAVREKGVGLIVEAGPNAMPFAFGEKLQKLLPVALRPGTAGVEPPPTRPFRVELTPEGSLHEALRFQDDPGRNLTTWQHMPPYYWCAPVERLAPGATALAVNPGFETPHGKLPLIAHHYAGQGRVLFLGTDSTWTWRQNVGDRYFSRFWGQGIRFVARNERPPGESFLEARPYRVRPGESVEVELTADPDSRPEATRRVRVPGLAPDGSLQLHADPAVKRRHTGKFTPAAGGDVRIEYDQGNGRPPLTAHVKVLGGSDELRHPTVNRPALEQWASASGGRVVELTDLHRLPEWLQGEAPLTEMHLEEAVWDNWLVLVVMVLLFSADVGLRRLSGLS